MPKRPVIAKDRYDDSDSSDSDGSELGVAKVASGKEILHKATSNNSIAPKPSKNDKKPPKQKQAPTSAPRYV